MPRLKTPIPEHLAGPVAELARDLRQLRAEAGDPSYEVMAKAGFSSKATLSTVDSGKRLPTKDALVAYLTALEIPQIAVSEMVTRWEEARRQARSQPGQMAELSRTKTLAPDTPPNPADFDTVSELVQSLRELLQWAGSPSYRAVSKWAQQAGEKLPASTIGEMLTKDRLPRFTSMMTLLRACGVPPRNQLTWVEAYEKLDTGQKHRLRPVAPNENSDSPPLEAGWNLPKPADHENGHGTLDSPTLEAIQYLQEPDGDQAELDDRGARPTVLKPRMPTPVSPVAKPRSFLPLAQSPPPGLTIPFSGFEPHERWQQAAHHPSPWLKVEWTGVDPMPSEWPPDEDLMWAPRAKSSMSKRKLGGLGDQLDRLREQGKPRSREDLPSGDPEGWMAERPADAALTLDPSADHDSPAVPQVPGAPAVVQTLAPVPRFA